MIRRILWTTTLLLLVIPSVSFAQSDHMEKAKQPPMKMASIEVIADGIVWSGRRMPDYNTLRIPGAEKVNRHSLRACLMKTVSEKL